MYGRSAPVARRPKAAASATGGGSTGGGGGGILVGPVAGHSEKQVEWLGRIDYYGGREMWRKSEDKFQQVRACLRRTAVHVTDAYIHTHVAADEGVWCSFGWPQPLLRTSTIPSWGVLGAESCLIAAGHPM